MPENVKVMRNTEEEKDVKQIAQAIGQFLKKVMRNTEEEKDVKQIAQAIGQFLNYEVSIKKLKKGYDLNLKDPADQKKYILAYLVPEKDKTTGDPYYEALLFFDVFLPAYMNRWVLPTSKYHLEPETMPKYSDRQSLLLGLKSSIVKKMKSYLENFEITDSYVGLLSFVLDLKKQSHA